MGFHLGASIFAAFAIGSAASPPMPLKPSGPWNVEYADSMCVLSRQFGSGDGSVTLGFRPGLFSEHMRMVVARKSTDDRSRWGEAQLSFDGGPVLKTRYSDGLAPRTGLRIMVIDLKAAELAPLSTAQKFQVRAGGDDFVLMPDHVAAAMQALNPCIKDLLISWGMNTATIDSIATYPKFRNESIFSSNDYPSAALRNREQGTTGVRYWVSKDGKISDCKVVERSGSVALDERTCSLINRRARYDPARTKAGEAVDAIDFARVHWVIPGM